jgi:hypothetical protein
MNTLLLAVALVCGYANTKADFIEVRNALHSVATARERCANPADPALLRLEVHADDVVRKFVRNYPEHPFSRFWRVGPLP